MTERDTWVQTNLELAGLITGAAKTAQLEGRGVFAWIQTCFPFAFEDDFSADHRKFWDLWWSILQRIKSQQKLSTREPIPAELFIHPAEYNILLILGRGLGKSSVLEASSVMRGAILGGGYNLIVCESQDQAEEHLGNQKILIEHPSSRLLEFYPEMAIATNATIENIRAKDRSDLFVTASGWICRAKGLDAKLRGIRIGNRRPDDICVDDVDDVNDSIAVSVKKLKRLLSSVIPTQARRWATKKIGQNLIVETGVINQIFTGSSDALAERTVIGVTNTFTQFDYESKLDPADGRIRHTILPTSIPSWAGVDRHQAQNFLNDSGLEVFLAEYQNSFEHLKTEKVFHEFNESRQIITWSDFERIFKTRHIPAHWQAKAASDIGYSKESLSAWAFVATSANNSPLPNHYFLYRGLTFCQASIDTQAEVLWEEMFPDPSIGKTHFEASQEFTKYPELFRVLKTKPRCADLLKNYQFNSSTNSFEIPPAPLEEQTEYFVRQAQENFHSQIGWWQISHEKTGEQKTLAQKYGLPVVKTKNYGATSGIVEANHLMRGDFTRPHPFFEDELLTDPEVASALGRSVGQYKLGSPYLFFIVDDDQQINPTDDRGLKTFREHIGGQRWTHEKLGEQGLTKSVPMKFRSDAADCLRMWSFDYAVPNPTALTLQEEFDTLLVVPPSSNGDVSGKQQQQQMAYQQALAKATLREKYGEDVFDQPDQLDRWWE